jgi:hypothetical protein
MAMYLRYVGRRVEVHYQAGQTCLPATGTLVADSGRSIFLEEHFAKTSGVKRFRWEIPYACIVGLYEDEPTL